MAAAALAAVAPFQMIFFGEDFVTHLVEIVVYIRYQFLFFHVTSRIFE